MIMVPDASIPIVQMSLNSNLSAKDHINIGLAIQSLRDDDIMIVGSGFSFHNFKYIFGDADLKKIGKEHSKIFDDWLKSALVSDDRKSQMENWETGCPSSYECHPPGKTEHLLPLHVVFGASGCAKGKNFHNPMSFGFY